ncbi:hypothetical protein EHQ31_05170 [Leptospira montravelensis]|uniref:Uncharacterized protein n=1 Tax=Leptospira montravelensis TaxID=2484961 RepID=A0ABY2LWL5_9LEPT|nr:hypothetical protein [Leptospira montravelensis]TGK84086.1 hypothetical protein EHQ19_06135 [Leptospira montravelensis]TGL06096.1 hypothetical protein EHQ31_05170 [Leptospira montravelensis]
MKFIGISLFIFLYYMIILPSHPHLYSWLHAVLVIMFGWKEVQKGIPELYISLPSLVYWLYIFYAFVRMIIGDRYLR